jgi:hypothetical protein
MVSSAEVARPVRVASAVERSLELDSDATPGRFHYTKVSCALVMARSGWRERRQFIWDRTHDCRFDLNAVEGRARVAACFVARLKADSSSCSMMTSP